jgi:hypothetical protein
VDTPIRIGLAIFVFGVGFTNEASYMGRLFLAAIHVSAHYNFVLHAKGWLNSDGRTSEMAVLHSYFEIIFFYFLNFNFNFNILISKKKGK